MNNKIPTKFNFCLPVRNTLNGGIITQEALETAIKNMPEQLPIICRSNGESMIVGYTTGKPYNISFDSDRSGMCFEIEGVFALDGVYLEAYDRDADNVITSAKITAIGLCRE